LNQQTREPLPIAVETETVALVDELGEIAGEIAFDSTCRCTTSAFARLSFLRFRPISSTM
jgi:hypothetical protein